VWQTYTTNAIGLREPTGGHLVNVDSSNENYDRELQSYIIYFSSEAERGEEKGTFLVNFTPFNYYVIKKI
jgi:hypothetical protein